MIDRIDHLLMHLVIKYAVVELHVFLVYVSKSAWIKLCIVCDF
jgi:hypothetical protein